MCNAPEMSFIFKNDSYYHPVLGVEPSNEAQIAENLEENSICRKCFMQSYQFSHALWGLLRDSSSTI